VFASPSTSEPTTQPAASALDVLRRRAESAGILLDFDGSLSAIVDRPDLAVAAPGAAEALAALVRRYRVVAIVSGRRTDELVRRLRVDGVSFFGFYGLQEAAPDIADAVTPLVERAVGAVPGARVEHKVSSLAVHYRQAAADPTAARAALLPALEEVAAENGLAVLEGKMVLELVPAGRPRKAGAVARILGEYALEAALFAGDDIADLEAFDALDEARERGILVVKVAVASVEAPVLLLERADVVVDGPGELVELLRQLA
jgi:trehalose 6-phosphate phosphatase